MDSYVNLAKQAIAYYLQQQKSLKLPLGLPPELLNFRAGVFVSLHRKGLLRGCIGTIEPTTANIAEEIIQNAISAAFEDPRFEPLDQDELKGLVINVDVLNPAIKIKNKSELDPKKFGVIVRQDYKRGLLLPDIEGVDSIDEQLDIAREKAGIAPNEDLEIFKFTVTRHE